MRGQTGGLAVLSGSPATAGGGVLENVRRAPLLVFGQVAQNTALRDILEGVLRLEDGLAVEHSLLVPGLLSGVGLFEQAE